MNYNYLILLFCIPLVLALKPGEQIETNLSNITNAIYPCIELGGEIFVSGDAPIGNYSCNITGWSNISQEQVIRVSGGGGGGRRIKPIIKPNITNQSINLTLITGNASWNATYTNQTKPVEEPIQSTAILPSVTIESNPGFNETKKEVINYHSWNWLIILGLIILTIIIIIVLFYSRKDSI